MKWVCPSLPSLIMGVFHSADKFCHLCYLFFVSALVEKNPVRRSSGHRRSGLLLVGLILVLIVSLALVSFVISLIGKDLGHICHSLWCSHGSQICWWNVPALWFLTLSLRWALSNSGSPPTSIFHHQFIFVTSSHHQVSNSSPAVTPGEALGEYLKLWGNQCLLGVTD